MTRQTELQRVTPFLGRDLLLDYTFGGGFFEDADLASARRAGAPVTTNDISIAEGIPAITQALANRLKTRKGELASLGHPNYGSRHHELIGEPNVERTRDLIKLYVLQALRDEPRIEKVLKADVDRRAPAAARERAHHRVGPARAASRAAQPRHPLLAGVVAVTYAAEPYAQFVDDLLLSLTGGVVARALHLRVGEHALPAHSTRADRPVHADALWSRRRSVCPLPARARLRPHRRRRGGVAGDRRRRPCPRRRLARRSDDLLRELRQRGRR